MRLPKSVNNYLKEKEKNVPPEIDEIKNALKRSGNEKYLVFYDDNNKLVLIDTSKDTAESGIITEGKNIIKFKNTDDFQSVTTCAYARYNILNSISNSEDLERVKEIFAGSRTWIIQCINNESLNTFEAHTAGMDNYSHLDFKIKNNIGEDELLYLLNTLCKSVQKGNAFKDGDVIENLYSNCDVVLQKTQDGYLEIVLEKSVINEEPTEQPELETTEEKEPMTFVD